jgi:cyclic pyranopterin monophosphate synthase
MKYEFNVESVNISETKGIQKHPVEEIECVEDHGIKGDAHAGKWHRQVSLLGGEAIDNMRAKAGNLEIKHGDFAENIVTRGIDWTVAKIGGQIAIDDVVMEVTQIGKECHTGCAISQAAGECIMPKMGIFAKVIKGGNIHAGSNGNYSI